MEVLNYIAGELCSSVSKSSLPLFEPASGANYGNVTASDSADVDLAVSAASRAFPQWSKLASEERSQWLRKLAGAIRSRQEEFARAESVNSGKPIRLAREVDIPRSIANLEFFAAAATQFSSESHLSQGAMHVSFRSPLGVVGTISPWNLPLYLLTWKIAPALAAGNCVVAKPSELTPVTAYLLSKVAIEIGFPKGVLNLVHGSGLEVGQPLASHAHVKCISFTGSTATGRAIAEMSAKQFKKCSLEMGGKNATLVFEDCDVESAVDTIVRSGFSNQGQVCLCGSRILVQKTIYQKFVDRFVEKARTLRLGDPLEESTDQGALVSLAHLEKVENAVEKAKTEGGRIILGGHRPRLSGRLENGWFFEPTIIEGLSNRSWFNQTEIFGPVVSFIPFSTEEEAIELANDSMYGLSASVWTMNQSRLLKVAEALEVGMVWGNSWMVRDLRTPFGGVKQSGVGREGGWEAMRFFTELKNVCIQYR